MYTHVVIRPLKIIVPGDDVGVEASSCKSHMWIGARVVPPRRGGGCYGEGIKNSKRNQRMESNNE